MDFKSFIIVVKQPPKLSLIFEISDDKKGLTIHDMDTDLENKIHNRPRSETNNEKDGNNEPPI